MSLIATSGAPFSIGVRSRSSFVPKVRTLTPTRKGTSRINVTKEIPTLLVRSPTSHKPQLHHEYSLTSDVRDLELAGIAGHRLLGSSQGFLLSVDPSTGDLHATNPLTGSRLPLPPFIASPQVLGAIRLPSSAHIHRYIINFGYDRNSKSDGVIPEMKTSIFEDRDGRRSRLVYVECDYINIRAMDLHQIFSSSSSFYSKVILSPSLKSAFVFHGNPYAFVRATLRQQEHHRYSWDPIRHPATAVHDAIFHKGRLPAIGHTGNLVVFDDPEGDPPRPSLLTTRGGLGKYMHWYWHCKRFLVESPNGEDLFLVLRMKGERRTRAEHVTVLRLDKTDAYYEWNQVKSIGDIAMFLGDHNSVSFSANDFPGRLRPNSIYFAGTTSITCDTGYGIVDDSGIFSLEDGSMQPLPFGTCEGLHPESFSMWLIPPSFT